MPGETCDASAYEDELRAVFGRNLPAFDLIFLDYDLACPEKGDTVAAASKVIYARLAEGLIPALDLFRLDRDRVQRVLGPFPRDIDPKQETGVPPDQTREAGDVAHGEEGEAEAHVVETRLLPFQAEPARRCRNQDRRREQPSRHHAPG